MTRREDRISIAQAVRKIVESRGSEWHTAVLTAVDGMADDLTQRVIDSNDTVEIARLQGGIRALLEFRREIAPKIVEAPKAQAKNGGYVG